MTGGAGFIGSHITDAYLGLGHDVVVIDNLSSGVRENVDHRAKFYEMDIRDDSVSGLFEKERFEIVNHHAAQMDVRRSVADPRYDASVNVLGGLTVLEQAKRFGVRKVIFASTGGAIYGEQVKFPADEDHPVEPMSPYGITKLATEKYLAYYRMVHGLDSVILRYANVYGPRQNPHGEAGVVAIFASKMLAGEQPVINGDGTQTRDYTYVSDVVKANVLALGLKGSETFNVGTAEETDVNQLFRKLKAILNPSCPEQHGPGKEGEQRRSVISYEKIKKILGWSPGVRLEEGLALTAEYFRMKKGPKK